ncbi:MAG: glycosyltransferase [Anaerolineales bacterium]|jgi:glycosyltransferase involved in cell wall biosynthesis
MEANVSKKVDLTIFLPNLEAGGAERALTRLANYFARQGLQVDMVLVQAGGALLKELSERVRVVDLAAYSKYTCTPKLIKYLRKYRPRVLLSSLVLTNLLAVICNRLTGSIARVVVREASTLSYLRRNSKWKKWLERTLVRILYPQANAVIAVSQGVANDLVNYTGISESIIEVIPNPVITEDLFQKASEKVGHPWVNPDQPPLVLSAGRLAPEKNYELLLRAFAMVRQSMQAHLLILGEGSERQKLCTLVRSLGIETDVDMPGFAQNPFAYMSKASVFVLSSILEGLPNVLIEAMACGCPVVSTDCPSGPNEILRGGKYGHLVPVNDVPAMAQAIEAVLRGDRRMPTAKWLEQYRIESVARRYRQVLDLPN